VIDAFPVKQDDIFLCVTAMLVHSVSIIPAVYEDTYGDVITVYWRPIPALFYLQPGHNQSFISNDALTSGSLIEYGFGHHIADNGVVFFLLTSVMYYYNEPMDP